MANEWRSVWGDTLRSIPALRAAFFTWFQIVTRDRGRPRALRNTPALAFPPVEGGTDVAQVAHERTPRGSADRNEALFRALPEHQTDLLVEVERVEPDPHQLRDAYAGRVEKLQDGAVSPVQVVGGIRRVEQAFDVGLGEDVGQPAPRLGTLEPLTRVRNQHLLRRQEAEVRPHGRLGAPDGRRGQARILERVYVVPKVLVCDVFGRRALAFLDDVPNQACEVAAIRHDRTVGQAALEREVVLELLQAKRQRRAHGGSVPGATPPDDNEHREHDGARDQHEVEAAQVRQDRLEILACHDAGPRETAVPQRRRERDRWSHTPEALATDPRERRHDGAKAGEKAGQQDGRHAKALVEALHAAELGRARVRGGRHPTRRTWHRSGAPWRR